MIVHTNKHGVPFQIDDEDFEAASHYGWWIASRGGYPTTNIKVQGRWMQCLLHVFLLGKPPEGLQWDHRDRDPLNNCRENLRLVSRAVNMRNRNLNANNTSGVTGVYRFGCYWQAWIHADERVYLGTFTSFDDAVKVRLEAERELWGDNR
jgi:hypothetical protein